MRKNPCRALGAEVDFIDFQKIELPMCDGDSAYSHPEVEKMRSRIEAAKGILIAAPVYNFYLNAAVKNLIELTGSAWEDKVVGFLNAAGGYSSYMSVLSVANSLMLDFRCVIVPRFVYAVGSAFRDGAVSDGKVARRIDEFSKRIGPFCKPTGRRESPWKQTRSCPRARATHSLGAEGALQTAILKPKPESPLEKICRHLSKGVLSYRSCLCKEKVRSLGVFPIW